MVEGGGAWLSNSFCLHMLLLDLNVCVEVQCGLSFEALYSTYFSSLLVVFMCMYVYVCRCECMYGRRGSW